MSISIGKMGKRGKTELWGDGAYAFPWQVKKVYDDKTQHGPDYFDNFPIFPKIKLHK